MSIHILMIDDDIDDAEIFKEVLEEINPLAKFTHARDGEEGLLLLRSDYYITPDFIFLDLNMPRLSGKQFLMALQQSTEIKNIPIIIYSTSKSPEDEKELLQLGATYFITKPTTFKEILKKIEFVISQNWQIKSTKTI